jgi:hypothetical protein
LRLEYAIFYRGLVGLYDMTSDADRYVEWLRTLLRDTNGVFIEWQEAPRPMAPSIDVTPGLRERGRANLSVLRGYTAAQVRYEGGPGMTFEHPLPAIRHTLAASADGRHWADAALDGVAEPPPTAAGLANAAHAG